MASRPAGVTTTKAPRLSSAQSSRRDQTSALHPGDVVGDPAPVPVQRPGQLGDPDPAVGSLGQLHEYLEVGQRQVGLLGELSMQRRLGAAR